MASTTSSTTSAAGWVTLNEVTPFPKRILLPNELDAFVSDAWSRQCRSHQFEVLDEATARAAAAAGSGFWLVLLDSYPLAALKKAHEQFGKKAHNVRFVTSVVFTAATSGDEQQAAQLGAFPESLTRFRAVLANAQLCPTALSTSTKRYVQLWCESLGGVFEGAYTGNKVTHLIAAKAMSDKYRAAVKANRPILTHQWVEQCFRRGKIVEPTPDMLVGCMLGAVVCAVNLPPAEHARMKGLVTQAGGDFLELDPADAEMLASHTTAAATTETKLRLFSQGCTHILSRHPVPALLLDQARLASPPVPIVSVRWAERMVEHRGAHDEVAACPVRDPEAEQLERERAAEKARLAAAEREAQQQRERAAREAEAAARRAAEEESSRRAAASAASAAAAAASSTATAASAVPAALTVSTGPDEIVYDPEHDDYLSGLVVVLMGLDNKAQEEAAIDIVRCGGGTRLMQLAGYESALHAHANAYAARCVLVCGTQMTRDRLDEKLRIECANRAINTSTITAPVVTFRWLSECYRSKSVAPLASFVLAAASQSNGTTAAGMEQAQTTPIASARGSSPFPSTTASAPGGLTRTSSLLNNSRAAGGASAILLSRHDSRAGTLLGDGAVDGPTNFAAFNEQLSAQKVTVSTNDASVRPALLKAAATNAAADSSLARLFGGLVFVVEAADPGSDAIDSFAGLEGEGDERKDSATAPSLRRLLFTPHKRLTVLKQLTDHGVASNAVLEAHQVRSAEKQSSLSYVIGGVCGSNVAGGPTGFKARYGPRAQFVSYFWVAACIKHERLLPLQPPHVCWIGSVPRALLPRPPGRNSRGALVVESGPAVAEFAPLCLSASGFSAEETEVIAALVHYAGGVFTPGFNSNNTHLIYNEAGALNKPQSNNAAAGGATPVPTQSKLQLAVKLGLLVVQPQWLLACIENKMLLPEAEFPVSADVLAQAQAGVGSRRHLRSEAPQQPSAPPTVVDTPVVPVPATRSPALASSFVGAPPTPLAAGAFAPSSSVAAAAARTKDAEDADGEIPSQLDENEEDELTGAFTRAIEASKFAKPAAAALPQSGAVRSKRASGRQAKAAPTAVVSPVKEASDEVVEAASSSTAVAPSKLSAKAAFAAELKRGVHSKSSASGRRSARAHVEGADEEDDGVEDEAELHVAPLKPVKGKATPVPQDEQPMDLDEDEGVQARAPAISPFKSKKGSAAAASDAEAITLQNAGSTLVAPQLLSGASASSSGKSKRFRKVTRDVTPPSTPKDAQAAAAAEVPQFRSAKHPAAGAAAPSDSPAAKRVRRRILDDSQEDQQMGDADVQEDGDGEKEAEGGFAAVSPPAPTVTTPASAAVSESEDELQPGSHRKPPRSSRAAAASKAKPAATKATPKSKSKGKGKRAVQESSESESEQKGPAEGEEEAEEEQEEKSEQSVSKRPARASAVKGRAALAAAAAADDTPESSHSAAEDSQDWKVDDAAAVAPAPITMTTPRSSRSSRRDTATPVAKESPASVCSSRTSRAASRRTVSIVQEEGEDEADAEAEEGEQKQQADDVSHSKPHADESSDKASVAAAVTTPMSDAPVPTTPVTPAPPIRSRFAKRTPPPPQLASPAAAAAAPASSSKRGAAARPSASLLALSTPSAPVRSDSLGGGPQPSKLEVEAAERARTRKLKQAQSRPESKRVSSPGIADADDPFAANFDDEEPAASAASAKPDAKGAPAVAAKSTEPVPVQKDEPAPKSKSKKQASQLAAKTAAELADDDATPPASPAKQPTDATTDAKQAAAVVAANDAEPAEEVGPARGARKPAAKRKRGAAEVDAAVEAPTAPVAAPAVPEKAAASSPVAAAVSPMKRTSSVKAALSLSSLRESVHDEEQAEIKEEVKAEVKAEEPAPASKRAKAGSRKKASQPASDEPSAADAAAQEAKSPAASATPAPTPPQGRKRKPTASQSQKQDEEAPAAKETQDGSPKKKARKEASSSSQKPVPVLTVSGLAGTEKRDFFTLISRLGAQVLDEEPFDFSQVTHHVCPTNPATGLLKRSEKLLVALARGYFVVDTQWVSESAKAKRWLGEAEFEWKIRAKDVDPMLPALQRWHPASAHAGQAFVGWRVVLQPGASAQKAEMLKKLVLFSGGKLLDESSPPAVLSTATHLLIDTDATSPAAFKKAGGKPWSSAQAVLSHHAQPESLQVASANYLIEHLSRLDAIDSYLLIAPARKKGAAASQPQEDGSQQQAGKAGSKKGSQKSSQRSQHAEEKEQEESEDDQPMEVDRTVRQRRALTGSRR